MSTRSWVEYIQDILDAIQEIAGFIDGMTFEQFKADQKTQRVVELDLLIIGEAATKVPDNIKEINSSIPWPVMRSLRNRIAHVYFSFAPKVIWDTVQNDLPQLVEPLEKLL
jgi:uncharacterized protein with HEPN domain